MKKIMLMLCAALLLCSLIFAGTANADGDFAGYYAPFGYSEDEDGDISEFWDEYPVYITVHLELNRDGTYEAIYFGALTTGKWEKRKTKKGNDCIMLTLEETVDKDLKETYENYEKDEEVFTLYPLGDNKYLFMEEESDEEYYLEKQQGKMDVDAVINKILEYVKEEE